MKRVFVDALVLREPFTGVANALVRTVQAVADLDGARSYHVLVPRSLRSPFRPAPNLSVSRSLLVGGGSPGWRVFYEQFLLPFSVARFRADYAHFPAYVAPRLLFLPFVLTVHDVIPFTHPAFCRKSTVRHFKFAVPRSVEKAVRVIVPSEFVRSALLEVFPSCPPEKVKVAPLAPAHPPSRLSASKARALLKERYGIDFPFFLFVGNIEPKKNLLTLLKAFFAARMRSGFPHKLLIVGSEGWLTEPFHRTLLTHDMGDMVETPGYLPAEDLPAFYRAAAAFCFPSLVEGFGLPVLEAMQEGTPCLLSDIPVFRETAGRDAVFLPPVDLAAWREAIERAAAGEYDSAPLRDARKARAARFTWERTARLVTEAYSDLEDEIYGG